MEILPAVADLIGDIDFDPDALHAKYLEERDKRLQRGTRTYMEVTGDHAHYVGDPYGTPELREPVFDEVQFLLIGGGYGSLVMGSRLRRAGIEDIRIIDSAGDVGGTWYWNRYPGAACDTEAYVYVPMIEDTGTMLETKYAYQPELLEQADRIADKFNLRENALFQTSVTKLEWDEETRRWLVSTDRGDRFRAQYVIMANGPMNRPKLPAISGIGSFKGHNFHTCRWDFDYTGGDTTGGLVKLKDKRVGIIGTGATAIQCIPHLGKWSKELYVFQRTPACVDLRYNVPTDPEWWASLEPGWQWNRMVNFAKVLEGLPDVQEDLVNDGWTTLYRRALGPALKVAEAKLGRRLNGRERSQLLELYDYQNMNRIRQMISDTVKDPKTAESLKPWYRQFCKRPTFHEDYYGTYNLPNVHLVDTEGRGVERVTEGGVVANGREFELDCLIFATGFEGETSFVHRAGYNIHGRGGRDLASYWSEGLRTFHGVAVDGFPNCFIVGRTQIGASLNMMFGATQQIDHIMYILTEAWKRGADTIEPTHDGVETFLEDFRAHHRVAERFWAECTPGYYNNEGDTSRKNGFFADSYGGGITKFFNNLAAWQAEGNMVGLKLEAAPESALVA